MSLLSGASIWTNDEPNKKRTPGLRRTIKKTPSLHNSDEYISEDQTFQESKHVSIDETVAIHENRNTRVNDLLNKITATNENNDGQHLSNFSPPQNPEINQKKGLYSMDELNRGPMNMPLPIIRKDNNDSNYSDNNMSVAKLSNYQMSYEPGKNHYYANMGLGQGLSNGNDKIMEKINYLIHMVEAERDEKTDTVIQDMVLYMFLGVFIIFICDSFARSGKYTR